jgi:hypothetical protein
MNYSAAKPRAPPAYGLTAARRRYRTAAASRSTSSSGATVGPNTNLGHPDVGVHGGDFLPRASDAGVHKLATLPEFPS